MSRSSPTVRLPRPGPVAQRGVTAIELMIALGLTVLILSAGAYVFIQTSVAYDRQGQVERAQENLRMAHGLLTQALRQTARDPDALQWWPEDGVLAVRHTAHEDEARDCEGNTYAPGEAILQHFWSADEAEELRCATERPDDLAGDGVVLADRLRGFDVPAFYPGDEHGRGDPEQTTALPDASTVGLRLELEVVRIDDDSTRPVTVYVALRNRILNEVPWR